MSTSTSTGNLRQNKEKEDAEDDNPFIVKRFGELELTQYGLGYEIFQAMKRNSDRVAQYIVDTNQTETYGELLENCIRVAINLKDDQFSADDALGLSSINHQFTCVPYIAALFLGIKVVAFDTSLSINDRIYLFQQLAPKVLFVDADILPSIEESINKGGFDIKIVVFGEDGNGNFILNDYLASTEEDISIFEPTKLQSNRDTAAILFSSGTTGMPKGICLSHYGLLSQGLLVILSGDAGGDENPVAMTFTQLYWISSIDFLVAALVGGIARVIAANYDPEELWGYIEKYRINLVFLSPYQCLNLSKSSKPEGVDTSSLHCLITAGGSLPKHLVNNLRDSLPGAYISQIYGQTELCGAITRFETRKVDDRLLLHYKHNSVGRAMPGFWYKVVDTVTERILGPNEPGELRIKSGCVMNGYYNRDSSEAFDQYGWFRTGDVVYYDEFQCFYVVDRIKELLKFRGWHIQPTMLENILKSHPAVQNAAVIGISDEEDGEHPLGLVVMKEGVEHKMSAKQLEQYVEERVQDRQRLRAGVKIVDSLPLTNTGKIKRNVLKNLFLNGEI